MSDRAPDFFFKQDPPPEGAICDFCSSPDVHWTYPAQAFTYEEELLVVGITESGKVDAMPVDVEHVHEANWAACNPCHALIERGDRDRLARRSAKRLLRLPDAPPMPLGNAIQRCRTAHDQFWSHREGKPIYHPTRPKENPL